MVFLGSGWGDGVNDTGQLLLFIQGMDAKDEVTEEWASKDGLHRATIDENSRENVNSVQPEVESAKMCYYPMVGEKKKKDVWSRKSLKRTSLQSMW